jgi:allophanate hydrolase subunit 1
MNLKEFFHKKRKAHDIPVTYKPCTDEENEEFRKLKSSGKMLPENIKEVYHESDLMTFEKEEELNLTQEQINELLMHKQIELLETIKTHTTFFYVLAIIGIVLGVIGAIASCAILG